jgi:hypothetical protein
MICISSKHMDKIVVVQMKIVMGNAAQRFVMITFYIFLSSPLRKGLDDREW